MTRRNKVRQSASSPRSSVTKKHDPEPVPEPEPEIHEDPCDEPKRTRSVSDSVPEATLPPPHICMMKAKEFYEYNEPRLPHDIYDFYPKSLCWPIPETSKPQEGLARFKYEDGRPMQQLPLTLFKRNGMQDYAYSKITGTPSYIQRY